MGRQATAAAVATALIPALGFALLLAAPDLDVEWHHDASHFWLVLVAAATTAVLAYATGDAADRRSDPRLFLVSLAFLAAAGFLALHALATPEVFLERSNLGFQIAVPVGLAVAAGFAAASASAGPDGDVAARRRVRVALVALMVAWAVATALGLAPLADVTDVELASGPIAVPALAAAALFAVTAARYAALARRRRALLPLAVATAFVLLGEAMVAIVFARNWHASWWEWHLLILSAFALVAWAARREWREERFASLYTERSAREVSVLFADLAGFTRFAERHEPEEVTAMLNAYLEVAIPAIVREHGGEVDKLIGDAIMATFTAPPDEPHHALRAARAALALRDRTATLADANPDWPRFRVGVNTGEAFIGVVGAGGGRSYTAIGDAVNTAARLEAQAPVGGIAIGAATMRRLPGARLEHLGAVAVKGKREPVDAYVLLAL